MVYKKEIAMDRIKVRREIDLPFIKDIEKKVAHITDFEERWKAGRKLFVKLTKEQKDEYKSFLSPSARFIDNRDGELHWFPGAVLYGMMDAAV